MRILLAEDDARVAGFLVKGLREQAYAVDVARDGEEAVYLATVNEYDLLILDVMLPVKDGHAVCRELRRGGARVPILMLTTESSDEMKQQGRAAGATGWIVKPFDPERLIEVVKKVIN